MGSLNKEAQASGVPVRVHCLSPGMVLTNLLLTGATDRNKQVCAAGLGSQSILVNMIMLMVSLKATCLCAVCVPYWWWS